MQAISYLEHPVRGVGCKETAIISFSWSHLHTKK